MKVKVSEATGPVLDWLVATAEDNDYCQHDGVDGIGNAFEATRYSTNWSQGGPIIEREKITADYFPDGGHPDGGAWLAYTPAYQTDLGVPLHEEFGPTFLIAAMRCYVASKLDDEVEVPDELA